MEAQRKRDVLAAEDQFVRHERLCSRLAVEGVYLIGPLTCPDRLEWETLEVRPLDAGALPGDPAIEKTATRGKEHP